MEAAETMANSAGSVGCTEEVPSQPSLERMCRSLPSAKERRTLTGGENRKGMKRSLGGWKTSNQAGFPKAKVGRTRF